MNLFGNLSNEGLEEAQDRIGGFRVYETDAYEGTIKLAYAGKSANSKSQSMTFVLELANGGEYRETLWVTTKDGLNFYADKQDSKKRHPLPGYTTVNDICLVTTNKGLNEQIFEEKVVNLWNNDEKKEVPTPVQVAVDLLGQKVILGIRKETRNKQVRNVSTGDYESTADSRDENSIDKVFHFPSMLTVAEAKRDVQKAEFYGLWTEKNRGQTVDRRTIKDGASAQGGRTGRPMPAGGPPKANETAAKTNSLFA